MDHEFFHFNIAMAHPSFFWLLLLFVFLFIIIYVCTYFFCGHRSLEVSCICGELNSWTLGHGPPLPVYVFAMKFCSDI